MKLELKHINPYAIYGLKGIFIDKLDIVTEIDFEHQIICSLNYGNVLIKDFKPVLKPLSDLSKFCGDFDNEHSINMLIGENDNYGQITLDHYKDELSLEIEPTSQDYSQIEFVKFELIEKIRNILLKNHYDIYGLIEQGLAIDINTLES